MHVGDPFDLGNHEAIKSVSCALDDLDDVGVAPLGIAAVHANDASLTAKLVGPQSLDDLTSRALFGCGRHGVLEVQKNLVGRRLVGFGMESWLAARDGEA
jgi:hypothetical protein